jgi:hypothetical protein
VRLVSSEVGRAGFGYSLGHRGSGGSGRGVHGGGVFIELNSGSL